MSQVDVEGAEVHVLRGLVSVMASIDNLVVETSPGWWSERHNVSRRDGAELYASLFEVHGFSLAQLACDKSTHAAPHSTLFWPQVHGFSLAVASNGRWISSAEEMRAFVADFGDSGYWSQ